MRPLLVFFAVLVLASLMIGTTHATPPSPTSMYDCIPNPDRPIRLPSDINVRGGDEFVSICVYSDQKLESFTANFANCLNSEGQPQEGLEIAVTQVKDSSFKGKVTAHVPAGTYICNLNTTRITSTGGGCTPKNETQTNLQIQEVIDVQ